MLNVPVNNFSVMLGGGHRFLGITSTLGGKYVLLKGTTRRPEWGSNRRLLDPGSEVLTTRPPRPHNYQGVSKSKELPGKLQFKGLPRSIIFKTTTGECQNQIYCQEEPQLKRIARECHKQNYIQKVTIEYTATTITDKNTVRKYSY